MKSSLSLDERLTALDWVYSEVLFVYIQRFLFAYIQCCCGCLEDSDQITEWGEERDAGRFRSLKYMLRLSKNS